MKRLTLALAFGLAVLPFGPAWGAPARQTAGSPCDFEHHISYWTTFQPAQPCAGQPLNLVVHACGECDHLTGAWFDGAVNLEFFSRQICPLTIICLQESLLIPLPSLASGNFKMLIRARARVRAGAGDSIYCDVEQTDTLAFRVADCPPGSGPLPFVTQVHIGPLSPCLECKPPICPGDSIPVLFTGVLPGNCWQFRGVELLPSKIVGPEPQPPMVRLKVARNDCLRFACNNEPVHWGATVKLPGLPSGPHFLMAEEAWIGWCDTTRVDSLFHANFPFRVAESCSTSGSPGCFLTDWQHGPDLCDTFVDRQHPGQVTMTAVTSTVPLAGLQGTLSFYPAGVAITDLTPVGPAATWSVAWTPIVNGAKFVMFSTDGSVIAPSDPVHRPDPVLRVTVAMAGDEPPAPVTYLIAIEMQASDPLGRSVFGCAIRMREAPPEARICFGGLRCDFNHDAAADVRDLVLMVNCVLRCGESCQGCPDLAALDCNGDGTKSLDDVLCCARVVLRGGMPGGVVGRPEPTVRVGFGAAVATAAGLDLPLRIEGVDRLGAARLALRYPSERYDVTGLELQAGRSEWLDLMEAEGADLAVGLIRIGAGEIARGSLELTLHLALKPGQRAGGDVQLASADFSGPDGAALEVGFTPATVPVGSVGRLALSAAQPNPFSRETRFSVTVPRPSEVEIVVHDLGGRRVATVFRGRLEAGTRGFRWAGDGDGGARVRAGIYFVRVRGVGEDVARKVILLGGG